MIDLEIGPGFTLDLDWQCISHGLANCSKFGVLVKYRWMACLSRNGNTLIGWIRISIGLADWRWISNRLVDWHRIGGRLVMNCWQIGRGFPDWSRIGTRLAKNWLSRLTMDWQRIGDGLVLDWRKIV